MNGLEQHLPVSSTSNGSRNRSAPFHLLGRDEIPRDEHPQVIPPLHHLVVAPAPEGVGCLVLSRNLKGDVASGRVGGRRRPLALDMKLVALGRRRGGRRTEGAGGEEQGEDGVLLGVRVRGSVLVEVAGGGENVVGLSVGLGEALLSLEETDVDGDDGGIILSGVVDVLWRYSGGKRLVSRSATRSVRKARSDLRRGS